MMSSYPMGFVSRYSDDFADIVYHLESAYERCNLWPAYETDEEFLEVLGEEILETDMAVSKMASDIYNEPITSASDHDFEMVRGMAIKVMLEAVQVVSVLDKYEACTLREDLAEEKPNE
ncbi:MAG: hypothetical protein ACLT3C_00160 [Peptococcus niger]